MSPPERRSRNAAAVPGAVRGGIRIAEVGTALDAGHPGRAAIEQVIAALAVILDGQRYATIHHHVTGGNQGPQRGLIPGGVRENLRGERPFAHVRHAVVPEQVSAVDRQGVHLFVDLRGPHNAQGPVLDGRGELIGRDLVELGPAEESTDDVGILRRDDNAWVMVVAARCRGAKVGHGDRRRGRPEVNDRHERHLDRGRRNRRWGRGWGGSRRCRCGGIRAWLGRPGLFA